MAGGLAPPLVLAATDTQSASVRAEQPAAFAFTLYKRLGQRHVVVVDATNHPVGMITREDLDARKAEHTLEKLRKAGDGKLPPLAYLEGVRTRGANGSNGVVYTTFARSKQGRLQVKKVQATSSSTNDTSSPWM